MHQFLKFIFGIKLYMFRPVPLSIMRSFSLYTQQWCMSYKAKWIVLCILIYILTWVTWRIRTKLQFRPDPALKLYDI